MTSTAEYCLMQQLRYSTSAAAADGLARDPASYAQLLVRRLRCGGALEPLADFVTVLRSPDAEIVAAAAVAAGVIEALERLMRGEVEVEGKEEGAVQTLAAVALTRLIPHNGGAALARFVTDKGGVIIGEARGCSGAAALKAWSGCGSGAAVLQEGESRVAALCSICSGSVTCDKWQLQRGLLRCRLRCRTSATM
jgi:hypothetical protein